MSHENFDAAAKDFRRWVQCLVETSDSYVQQAKNAFDGKKQPEATAEQMAELCLQNVSKRIEDVMHSFDFMLKSLNTEPRYEGFFRSLTDEWEQLRERMEQQRRADSDT